ncbi:uncharacterized protein J8A68_005174 [[Candida] subhashii]|uniref:RRM domain-containing protein n=1 Tax=[Candida] subhashii TaxID=561895 RepID=A0A8J5QHK5_9ASCO|nr:uncharacterized protein J8A68_005174 [[Candida] subhashii]KAG7661282.1 hypothetical protein J8A68_005174 [[Candida] subhashii]
MNSIQKINQINQKELNSNTSYKSSWHYDYRDTNYLYIGNIPFNLTSKDLIIIFSQYGIPTHINLIKDKETGNHRGFGFLKYSNFKSCILAIDNFNGIKLGDRFLRVDHNYYKLHQGENEDDYLIDYEEIKKQIGEDKRIENEDNEKEGEIKLIEAGGSVNDDDEFKDPMEEFLSKKDKPKDDDDEFRDPMEDFLSKERSKDSRKDEHTHRSHRSERHRSSSHRHRSDKEHRSSSHRHGSDKERSSRSHRYDKEGSSDRHKSGREDRERSPRR